MQQDKSPDYQKWRAAHVVLDDADRRRISNLSAAPDRLVRFVVRTFDNSSVPFSLASGPITPADWMIYLDGPAELHEAATFAFADAISRRPEVLVVYADHEIVGGNGLPIAPHLKPDWNADLALGHAYVGPVLAVRIGHLEKVRCQVKAEIKDKDPKIHCEIFTHRDDFLSLCQGNHYQFDQLRRAKHSTQMVLFHLQLLH